MKLLLTSSDKSYCVSHLKICYAWLCGAKMVGSFLTVMSFKICFILYVLIHVLKARPYLVFSSQYTALVGFYLWIYFSWLFSATLKMYLQGFLFFLFFVHSTIIHGILSDRHSAWFGWYVKLDTVSYVRDCLVIISTWHVLILHRHTRSASVTRTSCRVSRRMEKGVQ